MKSIPRGSTRSPGWIMAAMFFFFATVFQSRAQDAKQELDKQIDSMVETLKTELKENPNASQSLGLMAQLKMDLDDSNSDSIAALERGLVRQYANKHQEEILKIIRAAAEQVAQKNDELLKAWKMQIVAFVQAVKTACIHDASPEELNNLLLRVDTLKASQPKGRRSLARLEKIEREKFESAVKLLGKWIEYKRYAASGYEEKASEVIRSLKNSSPNYPILEKSFLDKKHAEVERTRAGAPMAEAAKKTGPSYETELAKMVTTLVKNKLSSQSVLKAVGQLEAISTKESDNGKFGDWNRINGSLRDLGDCLYYATKNDLVRARILLKDFVESTYNFKTLQAIREKAAIQLLPSLYAELGAQPLAPGESLTNYLFKLAAAPESLDGIALHYSYMQFYSEFYEYQYRPEWVNAAADQLQSLARAGAAMNCQDYPTALRHFRSALSHAPESGPANAEELVQTQIEVIQKRQPSLFNPVLADNLTRMEALERQINYYKEQLKKVSAKK